MLAISGVSITSQVSKLEDSGSTTLILEKFLQPLKAVGFDPLFFGCDKDRAEISAMKQVWPDTTVQLCYWHAKRAIRKKLSDPKKTATQWHYFPHEAKALVPALEICWGSYPTRRPDGDHRYGHCQCPSSSKALVEFGRVETSEITERNIVLAMFSRHYNMHSMIPDQNGTYRSAEIYTPTASTGYILGVVHGITSVYGLIFSLIGMLQYSGNFGPGHQIPGDYRF
ncbi:hypothetical protein K3495_g12055 [Podosphaera aphanis]|nr:hypothetical protein K3495_g12055 [Podosphaera aphanis]